MARPSRSGRPATLIERTRRAQLIEVTVDQVAQKGYAHASLSAIAEAAEITKAAVLYHFPSKDSLVDAAYEHVLQALTETVAAALEQVDAAQRPAVYARSMISHLRAHQGHTRMIIEALSRSGAEYTPQQRWAPLAQLIDEAAAARGAAAPRSRTLAIIIGGAIDAIVTEGLHDANYDTALAADELVTLIDAALRRQTRR